MKKSYVYREKLYRPELFSIALVLETFQAENPKSMFTTSVLQANVQTLRKWHLSDL